MTVSLLECRVELNEFYQDISQAVYIHWYGNLLACLRLFRPRPTSKFRDEIFRARENEMFSAYINLANGI
jgi:hypothetical protein